MNTGDQSRVCRSALTAPEELDLAKQMIRFGDVLLEVERTYKPNMLAGFLYDLATKFNLFYQAHPVLKAPMMYVRHACSSVISRRVISRKG